MERVELHLHTKMTEMKGLIDILELLENVEKQGMTAVAITDFCTVQAFPQIERYAYFHNIKAIYGCEVVLKDNNYCEPIILLVQNQIGLKNLYKMISEINKTSRKFVNKKELEENREGLLIGGLASEILKSENCEELIKFYDYIEVRPQDYKENEANKKIFKMCKDYNKIIIAASNAYYLKKEDKKALDVLCHINNDDNMEYDLHFRTTKEMLKEFEFLGKDKAYEIVVEGTNKIANMCDNITIIPDGKFYPRLENAEKDIEDIAYHKAHELYGEVLPEEVQERLEKELNIIKREDYSSIYMIAQKLVKKSNELGHMVGSRGGIASSLVANFIGITEINPLKPHYRCLNCKCSNFKDYGINNGYDLPNKTCPKCNSEFEKDGMYIPFETLVGFDGEKEPDIVLNFSRECQEEIQEYLKNMFNGNACNAGTIGTIWNETALDYVEKYQKDKNEQLSDKEKQNLVGTIRGVKKVNGVHPGGIIIYPTGKEIYDFTPLDRPNNQDVITTHFDYHEIWKTLLKMDILKYNNSTLLKRLEKATGIKYKDIPFDDKETMDIFTNAKTDNIYEFGTTFVQNILKITKPTTFDELMKISSLSHGTDTWINNAEYLIKNNIANLKDVLASREDIMNYLIDNGIEKKIAYEIMELVRKGKANENSIIWEEHAQIMREHNIPDWYIESCVKIRYMFPKAHVVNLVKDAYRFAWYKVHYPKEFSEFYEKPNYS